MKEIEEMRSQVTKEEIAETVKIIIAEEEKKKKKLLAKKKTKVMAKG